MKSYTDINQSRKLAEILPLESADMFWYRDAVTKEAKPRIMDYMQIPELQSMYYSPCWSLVALLDVIPYCSLRRSVDGNWIVAAEFSLNGYRESLPNKSAIEACYEMILRLHEQKVL